MLESRDDPVKAFLRTRPGLSSEPPRRTAHACTARHLRTEAWLADRGGSSVLRSSRPAHEGPHRRRAIRRPQALGPGVAGSGRSALPHRGRGGAAGRRPQRVEPRQPARAVLGGQDQAAPPGACHHLRSALVLPSLSPAHAHHHQRHHSLRPRRGRRRLPRSPRHALRSLRPQDAQRRGLRPLLPLQPRAGGGAVSPHRARRARCAQRLPGHRPHPRRPLLRQGESGPAGGLHRVLRRDRRALRHLHLPARRPVGADVGRGGGRSAQHVPPPRRGDLATRPRAARRLAPARGRELPRRPRPPPRLAGCLQVFQHPTSARSEENSMATTQQLIPARRGAAARVAAGQRVKVINTDGAQVVDTWAFSASDVSEWMSMEASRAWFLKLRAAVGDTFLTNQRRPIMTLVEDTSGGAHDTLMAACDLPRYRLLGVGGHHDNCRDNLHAALKILGLTTPATPSPLNLFMNIPWSPDGTLAWAEPVSTPGSYAVLRAEMDLVVAFSACPQDILPINGRTGHTTEAHFIIE